MTTLREREQLFESNRSRALQAWQELIRFPSISADPTRKDDCIACAQWLTRHLIGIGFEARLIETCGLPVVYAERPGPPNAPVTLCYGHYDVQPVDPVALWKTPPFEPVLKNGRLYGRGAQDNKGQMMYTLAALAALIQSNQLTSSVKIVLEGEEESSGGGLQELLERQPNLFRADVLLVTDTGMDNDGHPTVTMGLRGIVQTEVSLRCAAKDLHSGIHGGVAPNAAHAAARLVASLHHADGRVAVKGFTDGVREPTPEERRLAAALRLNASDYRKLSGADPLPGEKQFTLAERIGFRPCLDVNGLTAGHAGPGFKTVIPGEATLKLSARLVSGQDPEHILELLIEHLQTHTPPEAQLTIVNRKNAGPALRVALDSPAVALARKILDSLSDKRTVFRWEGASIPIVAELARASGATPLLVGFGLEADNIHAPNESFSLDCFRMGFLFVAGLLSEPVGDSS